MVDAEIELLGQRHSVQLKYETRLPISVPVVGGGENWHNPDPGRSMVLIVGKAASRIVSPTPVLLHAKEYTFFPARLTAEGMAGELRPAHS